MMVYNYLRIINYLVSLQWNWRSIMSNGFKEMLDDAIKRNIVEIKQPIEMEIRKIFTEKIEQLNFVRKSEFEPIIKETFKKLLSDKKFELKKLIRESIIKELIQGNWEFKEILQKNQPIELPVKPIQNATPPTLELKPEVCEAKAPTIAPTKKFASLKEFITTREFSSRNQQFRGVAYYLTKHENLPYFNIKDLREAYEKANLKVHPNFGITARDNVKSDFFETVSEKKEGFVTWKITHKTLMEFEGGAL
jgi:hypothetical protein